MNQHEQQGREGLACFPLLDDLFGSSEPLSPAPPLVSYSPTNFQIATHPRADPTARYLQIQQRDSPKHQGPSTDCCSQVYPMPFRICKPVLSNSNSIVRCSHTDCCPNSCYVMRREYAMFPNPTRYLLMGSKPMRVVSIPVFKVPLRVWF